MIVIIKHNITRTTNILPSNLTAKTSEAMLMCVWHITNNTSAWGHLSSIAREILKLLELIGNVQEANKHTLTLLWD